MNRRAYADLLMRDVQGLEGANANMNPGYGYDGDAAGFGDDFGADDPIKRAGYSTLPITLQVANAAALAVTLFSNTDVDAAALPTGVTAPVLASYKSIVKYLLANPAQVNSVILQSNESASTGAPLLSSLRITPTRTTPFGLTCGNEIRAQSYQTTQDFQANRITIPMSAILDGFTTLVLASDTNGSGATVTFNVTFLVGKRVENRRSITPSGPVAVAAGGRGVRAVGGAPMRRR